MPGKFQLPQDGLTYTQEILTRCRGLIQKDVWKDLDISRFRRWIANFRTDEEKYFAACVLDGLVYRSHDQTVAMINQLLQRTIPDLFRFSPPPNTVPVDFLQALKCSAKLSEPGFRFVTAVKQVDPPTKSAHYVARILKRSFAISEDWIIKAWDLPAHISKGIKTYLFIDDFLGTGDQFESFFQIEGIASHAGIFVGYVPLTAHRSGIQHLNTVLPSVMVSCVELLGEGHGLFSPTAKYFDDGVNTSGSAKEFFYDLMTARHIPLIGRDRGGYGGLELAYVFEHAAPDNCLPILWWRQSPHWIPLFDR